MAKRALVEALAEVHLEVHGGDVEKSLAAISAGKSTKESLANLGDPDIEATLGHVASTHGSTANGDADRTASYAVGTATSDGQRFRVLRPHARGGLGAVFVALDSELNREVALKQILDHHADDATSRLRFLLEAEVTGGLEHPGIVPVYGLGTDADGRPYYAMRFIRGDSLKEAIDRFHGDATLMQDPGKRSLEMRKLLRRFLDVCNAIDYAHSRGVLHRDIKPGNIIVGRHGETLVVDWGLAKATGKSEPGGEERTLMPSSAMGSAETLPGSALGTPAYMSPEQARGDLDQLGPRSDVYSLGATLYCLLTGKPPQQGDDVFEVVRTVQRGEFTPPRQVDPAIDKALEAVCLKAMAAKPEDRYASCRALADDVERWMADEPVAAYCEPTVARLGRWVRRHKPAVAGAAALSLTALVALALSTVLVSYEQAKTRDAYRAEAEQRRRAEARSRLARRAVDDMYTQVAEQWLAEQPRMERVQREFLEKARSVYEELAKEPGSEPTVRREAGAAYRRVGEVEHRLGHDDLAEQNHRRAIAIAEELSAAFPGAPSYRLDVALAVLRLGEILTRTGRHPEGEQALRRAQGILTDLAHAEPDRREYRRTLAEGRRELAYLMRLDGRRAEAEQEYHLAVELEAVLEREGDEEPTTLRVYADTLNDYANALYRAGRHEDAVRNYRQAIGLYDRLIAGAPGTATYRASLAFTLTSLGFAVAQQGDFSAAEREYRRAIDFCRRLVADFPHIPDYRKKLAFADNNLGLILQNSARPTAAEAAFRQAIGLTEALTVETPGVPDLRADMIQYLGNFGNFLQQTGKPREAEAILRRAVDLAGRLVVDFPKVPEYRVIFLALNLYNLADLLRNNGRVTEGEAAYTHALEALDGAPAPATDIMLGRLIRAGAWGHLGQARLGRSESAGAARLLGLALDASRTALELDPHNIQPLNLVAEFGADLSRARLMLGERAGAADAATEAASAAGELPRAAGEQPESFVDAACLFARCAPAAGDPERQREYEDRAAVMLRMAVAKGFRDADRLVRDQDVARLMLRPDLQLLMMDLAMPADPFAR